MQKNRVLLLFVCVGLLAAVGLGANATVAAQSEIRNALFKTPEETITLYMQGVAQRNISKIMQACAIDEMSKKFRFDLSIARIQALNPFQSEAPSEYPFYAEMNKAQLSAQMLSQVRIFTYSLLSSEDMTKGTIIMKDEERATKFAKDVDPARLAKLEVKKMAMPYPKTMQRPKYVESVTKLAQVYGADEYTERVALLQFEGNNYLVGFSLLRYGNNWKIMQAGSPLANMPLTGATGKITESDFENMIK
jgi:hypothetical protein